MSMPYRILRCDACKKFWHSSMLWGEFRYRLPDGREANVARDWGWCYSCLDAAPIERLPAQDEVDGKIKEAENDLRKVLPKTAIGRWFVNFQKNRPRDVCNPNIFEKIELRQRIFDELVAKGQLLSERSTPPKCLECGSEEVIRFDLPEIPESAPCKDPPKFPTAHTHPVCGGNLWLTTSGGERIALGLRRRLYDGNGNPLDEIPDRGLINPYGAVSAEADPNPLPNGMGQ